MLGSGSGWIERKHGSAADYESQNQFRLHQNIKPTATAVTSTDRAADDSGIVRAGTISRPARRRAATS